MKKKRYSEERITAIVKLCEAGRRVPELAREHGVSEGTIYGWKAKFGGMNVADAKRLRALEEESRRLRQMVADLCLDKDVLKSVIQQKRLELAGLRRDVARAIKQHGISERRACKLVGIERMIYRYEPQPDRNATLWEELVVRARQKPRWGYRRLHILLKPRGIVASSQRVYRKEGLAVRRLGASVTCASMPKRHCWRTPIKSGRWTLCMML